MPRFSNNQRINLDGMEQQVTAAVIDSQDIKVQDGTVLNAQAAVLTTRTNNTDGTLTMNSASHGIVTGQRLALYWSGGKRFHAIAGTVSGTTVPFTSSSGGGDNLPAATTPINVGIPFAFPFKVNGNNVTAIFLNLLAGWNGYFEFDAVGTPDQVVQYVSGGQPFAWPGGNSNILLGVQTITLWISVDNLFQSATPMAGVLYH